MSDNDFENEVLVRLSVIEEKLTSLENAKSQTYDNSNNIALIGKRISDIESKIKAITSAIVSIFVGVAVAGIVYLLKF